MRFWLFQLLSGVSFGMLLFPLAAGLSLIYGVLRILNLAHGAYYALSAYVALAVSAATGNLAAGAVAGIGAVMVLGGLMERLLRRVGRDELPQALLTFGVLLVVGELCLWIWGGAPHLPGGAGFGGGS